MEPMPTKNCASSYICWDLAAFRSEASVFGPSASGTNVMISKMTSSEKNKLNKLWFQTSSEKQQIIVSQCFTRIVMWSLVKFASKTRGLGEQQTSWPLVMNCWTESTCIPLQDQNKAVRRCGFISVMTRHETSCYHLFFGINWEPFDFSRSLAFEVILRQAAN